MAELLVHAPTGHVLHVAGDGHRWGRRESRAIYDAETLALGRPPRTTLRTVEPVAVVMRDGATGAAIIGPEGKPRTVTEMRVLSTTEVDTPPPSVLGIVQVPGDAADWEHLAEPMESGEPRYTLDLTPELRADIVAGTVVMADPPIKDALKSGPGLVGGSRGG